MVPYHAEALVLQEGLDARHAARTVPLALLVCIVAGCSALPWTNRQTKGSSFLTPPSTQTLEAFRFDTPIKDQDQAAIAAQLMLTSTRLRSPQSQIVSAQELSVAEARSRLGQAGGSLSPDWPAHAPVWLVIFRGDWQVFPPDPWHTITPPPATEGCVFVLMGVNNPRQSQVGTIACGS